MGALPDQALADFKERIAKYEEVYETITDRNLHYIKLIDMCAHLPTICQALAALRLRCAVVHAPHLQGGMRRCTCTALSVLAAALCSRACLPSPRGRFPGD